MSDFGASITISKKDENSISSTEKDSIHHAIKNIASTIELTDSLGENFLFELIEFENSSNSLSVKLSEYWFGEGDDEENFDFAEENDLPHAQEIAKLLEQELGTIFLFEAKFENW